jgi:hypothetical protein
MGIMLADAAPSQSAFSLTQGIVTACLTFGGGCLLYLFSQLVTECIVKPYTAYRAVLGKITYKMIVEAGIICSVDFPQFPERSMAVSTEIRALSASLRKAVTSCPFPRLLRALRLVPPPAVIHDAAGKLIRISNLMLETNKKYELVYNDFQAVGTLLDIDLGRG